MGKKQKKSADDSAKDGEIDIDALAAEIEGAGATKEQAKAKVKKKKPGKKEDFDEEEILRELEELSLENQGGKSSKEAASGKKPDATDDAEAEPVPSKADKKMRKGKKASVDEESGQEAAGQGDLGNGGDQQGQAATASAASAASDSENEGSKPGKKAKGARRDLSQDDDARSDQKGGDGGDDDSDDDSSQSQQRAQVQKNQKGKAKPMGGGEEDASDEDDGTFKMKTAAQKKAEKKERERKKKEEERAKLKKQKDKKEKPEEKEKESATEVTSKKDVSKNKEPTAPVTAEAKSQESAVAEEQDRVDEDEGEGDKKKKDKKKKKGEKEEKKKGPSKATVKAMQEALARLKEEEERARQEEEARRRWLEEQEAKRQEQERLEQERKEKKKQKEKERKERLKKEGKLLTKAQKEARARAEVTLKLLQAQGVDVPSKDGVAKKRPVYSDKRKKKTTAQTPDEAPEAAELASPTSETAEPICADVEVDAPPQEAVKDEKPEIADLDDWEAMASDEEKEMKKVHIEVKGTSQKKTQPEEEDEGSEEEEDDEDDDEEEEDDDEEEEEDEDEEESEEEDDGKQEPRSRKKSGRGASSESSSESDSDDGRTKEERLYDKAKRRIEKRRQENLKNINLEKLRAPVVCVLGHVDTGKTKILDKLRHTHVQDGEAGGITQQIGATNVPQETIIEQTKMVKNFDRENIKIPGMLIIDTPGHESFSNLRNRGSSLCDIAILVVDIMHGLEPQTLESINLLKEKKCPFIVALNKIDRLYDWKKSPETDVVTTLKKQKKNTKDEFDERAKAVIVEFAQQGLNAALFYENKDPRTFVSLIPTSAHSGDGMGNLIALLVDLTQSMLARRLAHCEELRAQVMEVKALPGMGTTIDVILINGRLCEGETIIVPGVEGPIVTQIRGLLVPPPLKELRVKNQYEKHKVVSTAQGVKILGKDLEKTLAGLPLLVAEKEDEIPVLRDELIRELKQTLSSIKLEEKGVYVQASTLGSLEALLEFLRTSKVPYAGINIGPVHKKDVMKASTMLEHDPQFAVILAFDVKIERDSQELADSLGVRIFSAEIIYHLFDAFTKYREDYKKQKQDEFKNVAVFPCKIRILPQFIFNSRDPIVMGVSVEAGVLRQGTPLCVPSKAFVDIGIVTSIENNHKAVDSAKKGQEICVKIEPIPGESPKMFGRHFEATDIIVSKITRQSIDALKNWFRDEMQKSDWQLIMELKKTFEII
ncbi:eukaryotic translation initiation factor 5B isoform X2 [Brienomyrus brachyistius]|uniref:eukaryotic translation initiation factor 5B isoform X2 n=1 Tax=Brienomyrus brachyistius TaxID=42636 RepID=UPI0020B2DB9C|nr:eukaryotic translation initiation factor 5B isoform X2 [Brienomyrus brachyistius]